jgi:predicted nucleic acid-binding protein
MPKAKILDTNVLINHWNRFSEQERRTPDGLKAHAEELIEVQGTKLIVSPVLIEFLGGALTSNELALYQAFLAPFEVLDKGNIPRPDWEEARRFAQRIKNKGRKRKLGDCLIQVGEGESSAELWQTEVPVQREAPGVKVKMALGAWAQRRNL